MADKKIKGAGAVGQRRQLLDLEDDSGTAPSRSRQCELLGLQRSGTYYKPRAREGDAAVMAAINETYAKDPCLGARRMPDVMERRYGIKVGRKRVLRLKREMGLRTVYCHPRTSTPGRGREGKRPYLLGEMKAIGVDEVWTSDITYLQIGSRNYYLCAVMDWLSRCVLGWALGADMGLPLCMRALDMALGSGRVPKVFNTDQGSQYTSREWQERMSENGIAVSQDGKGRWADNIVMERFWRTYKHEFFLLREPDGLEDARSATAVWMDYYNTERPHATLGNMSPAEYRKRRGAPPAAIFSAIFPLRHSSRRCRGAPSLRSGRCASAPKSLKKWLDKQYSQVV